MYAVYCSAYFELGIIRSLLTERKFDVLMYNYYIYYCEQLGSFVIVKHVLILRCMYVYLFQSRLGPG